MMKRPAIYFKGEKIATIQTHKLTLTTGSEQVDGQEAVIAATKGNLKVAISWTSAILDGMPDADGEAFNAIIAQEEVELGFALGGRYVMAPMAFTQFECTGDNGKGTCYGDWAAHNSGKPQFV